MMKGDNMETLSHNYSQEALSHLLMQEWRKIEEHFIDMEATEIESVLDEIFDGEDNARIAEEVWKQINQ
jgi:hypothetical protein